MSLPLLTRGTTTLSRCLALIGPEMKTRWIGLILLAVLVSGVEAVAALLIVVVVGGIVGPEATASVPLIAELRSRFPQLSTPRGVMLTVTVVGGFFVVRAAITLTQSYLQHRVAHGTSALLAKRLLHGYLAMPYQAYVSRNSAAMIQNAHQSSLSLVFYVLFPGLLLTSEVFVIVALATVLIVTAPLVAGATFLFLGTIVLVLLRVVQPRLLSLGRLAHLLTTASLKSLQQTLLGLRDIRMLGREGFFEEEFAHTRLRLARAYATQGLLVDAPRITLETSVLVALLLFVGLEVGGGGSIQESAPLLGVFGYAAFRILPSANRVVNSLQSLRFASAYVDALYDDAVAASRQPPAVRTASPMAEFRTIELRNVTFRYPERDHDALSQIRLTIERGESIGIVGQTGGGKSTLLDLILGLLDPTGGDILIDGTPLRDQRASWQRAIGLVPQTVFLLDDTIRRNIALGLGPEEVDEGKLAEALQVAELADFVAALPRGLETVVGERGVKLSGGQRQRIAIARAVYTQPRMLVFDEGTSALDGHTEARVLRNLFNLGDGMTLLHVAHRLSTIRQCDRVVVVSHGRIAGIGRFDELLERNEEFRSLTRSHFDKPEKTVDVVAADRER